ncbi:MAG: hypothetical protein ACRDRX_04285 [Pseudonocardiaceae bacterium]
MSAWSAVAAYVGAMLVWAAGVGLWVSGHGRIGAALAVLAAVTVLGMLAVLVRQWRGERERGE